MRCLAPSPLSTDVSAIRRQRGPKVSQAEHSACATIRNGDQRIAGPDGEVIIYMARGRVLIRENSACWIERSHPEAGIRLQPVVREIQSVLDQHRPAKA